MYRMLLLSLPIALLVVLFEVLLVAHPTQSIEPGPKYPPTKGEIWPKPQYQEKNATYYSYSPDKLRVKITGHNCSLLTKTIERYVKQIKILHEIGEKISRQLLGPSGLPRLRNVERIDDENYSGDLLKLNVKLTSSCEAYPNEDMSENYTLTVKQKQFTIQSNSIWGVIRAFESFSQLFYLSDDYREVRINSTKIHDYPRYPHRGLLIDTGRHYLPLHVILKVIDGMAINKMNVFHWHITDDQSFPYQSTRFPDLSKQGAYHPTLIYTKDDVQTVIKYATDRGIRVIPEFDVPGHTRSWGVAYPGLLTKCYQKDKYTGLGPINPTKNTTYKFLRDLFGEVHEVFPDKYLHIGGDEVDFSCWASNHDIQNYMRQHNLTNVKQLHALFMSNTIPLLKDDVKTIVWQEVFDNGVPLSKDTLIQVWKTGWEEEMFRVLSAGHKVLFSASYYLDILGQTVYDLYTKDPRQMIKRFGKDSLEKQIVGGEACMWGEMVNEDNVLSRIWPRASAVAEVLWSTVPTTSKHEVIFPVEARHRLEEHACRMRRRGIPAEPPLGPGFCIV